MASLRSRYAIEGGVPLLDVTVTTVGAGKTHRTTANGNQRADSQGVSQTTHIGATLANASNQTTQSGGIAALDTLQLSGAYGDGCDLFVIPPLDAAGKQVDCEIRPVLDGTPLEQHFNASAGVNDNLFPVSASTVGMGRTRIGIPYRKALHARVSNLPLKATGWKYRSTLQFDVYSNIGFGVSAAPTTPLRIIVLGDLLDRSELSLLNADLQQILAQLAQARANRQVAYDPFAFLDKVPGFPAFAGRHSPPGSVITSSTWTALPNGPAQVGTGSQIFRFVRQAYPNVASDPNNRFYLTANDAMNGATGDVASELNDLGFDHTSSKTYLRLDLLGLRGAANQAFVGVRVNSEDVPTPDGLALTTGVNLYPGGEVQPARSDSNLFFSFGKSPWPLAVYQNKVVFFVTPNGTAMNAEFSSTPTLQDAPQVAVGGIEIITAAG